MLLMSSNLEKVDADLIREGSVLNKPQQVVILLPIQKKKYLM